MTCKCEWININWDDDKEDSSRINTHGDPEFAIEQWVEQYDEHGSGDTAEVYTWCDCGKKKISLECEYSRTYYVRESHKED